MSLSRLEPVELELARLVSTIGFKVERKIEKSMCLASISNFCYLASSVRMNTSLSLSLVSSQFARAEEASVSVFALTKCHNTAHARHITSILLTCKDTFPNSQVEIWRSYSG
jgi:hypothetical protein